MALPRYRTLLELVAKRQPWACARCTQINRASPWRQARRGMQTAEKPQPRQGAAPTMEQMRKPYEKRNANTLYYAISIILGTVALSYGSVPLYKTICQQTGWGGQPIKSSAHAGLDPDADIASKLTPITTSRRLRITFAGSTSDILPWKFTPQQHEVRVLPGETALAFYTATNQSKDEEYNRRGDVQRNAGAGGTVLQQDPVFCFEEQRLNKGETVDMPVFFYIDPEFLKDPTMKGIDTITLNYTFFKAKYDKNGHLAPVPMPY